LLPLAALLATQRVPVQTPDPRGTYPSAAHQKPATPKRATATETIIVGAHLTPEEIEDGKIYDAYQPIYHWTKPRDCPEILKLCETKIIPMAERSKFEETRNKFLFLANREIAGCEMKAGEYQEAEQRYQKLFDYIPVWPGTTDSDYPQNYQAIGAARIMQGKWKDAEAPLEVSIEIFDEQIEKAVHSDLEFSKNEYSKDLKMSEAEARNLLAVAYFRDGRQAEAMEMLEKAYQESLQSSATPEMIQQIIESGRAASAILGDAAAKAKWDARIPPAKKNLP
jgi:tetratricopeptide (TPR) repeat protein